MMRLTPEAMKRLFHPTIEKIKATIGEVLNSPDVKGKNEEFHLNRKIIFFLYSRYPISLSCWWFC
jgi:predicted GNAT family N-acyltransferase